LQTEGRFGENRKIDLSIENMYRAVGRARQNERRED
jgi:hypothetical protein